jgi:ferritin-like metal-binding protein YciE
MTKGKGGVFMEALQDFFMEEFRELYRREKRWMIILPEVARNLSPVAVDRAVTQHLEQTAARVLYLENIFQLMAAVDSAESRAIRPLLKEVDEVLTAVALSSTAVRRRARRDVVEDRGDSGGGDFSRN